jgi:hypothetical protein
MLWHHLQPTLEYEFSSDRSVVSPPQYTPDHVVTLMELKHVSAAKAIRAWERR